MTEVLHPHVDKGHTMDLQPVQDMINRNLPLKRKKAPLQPNEYEIEF